MTVLPKQLLEDLSGVKGFDRNAFEKVHSSGEQVTSIRINPLKPITTIADRSIGELEKIPWSQSGYYLPARPSFTFDPFFHAGTYYVQEASSMFLEQALKQTIDLSKPLRVLDLSAAPGGKSTHIQSLLSKDSLLVSNEVIRSRANILKDNIIKWGCENVMVTNNDPKDFAAIEDYFDVIVVDAPCSGSGLFRRDPEAINEWSENNVQLCSQRQQRIIGDVWPALKKDGILIYSTCSYSEEEDEDIIKWLTETFPIGPERQPKVCPLHIDPSWNIIESNGGYRFWPDKVKGEGFFLACFQKQDGEDDPSFKIKTKPAAVNKKEIEVLEKWVKKSGLYFIKHLNTVYAWPETLSADLNFLLERLRVIYSGILTGELVRDKLIPDHALAMSGLLNENIHQTALDHAQAIAYLQRKELKVETLNTGWQIVTYQESPLGWINSLPNRINNYYPKELRILKDI